MRFAIRRSVVGSLRGDSAAECGELERLLRRDRTLSGGDEEKTSHFSELSMPRECNEVGN